MLTRQNFYALSSRFLEGRISGPCQTFPVLSGFVRLVGSADVHFDRLDFFLPLTPDGRSPLTVSRSLTELKAAGFIDIPKRGEIIFTDPAGLAQFAQLSG